MPSHVSITAAGHAYCGRDPSIREGEVLIVVRTVLMLLIEPWLDYWVILSARKRYKQACAPNVPVRLMDTLSSACSTLRALYDLVVVELYISYTILGDRLDCHTLEIYRHSPLELVRAKLEQLHALHKRDVWVVMLVED